MSVCSEIATATDSMRAGGETFNESRRDRDANLRAKIEDQDGIELIVDFCCTARHWCLMCPRSLLGLAKDKEEAEEEENANGASQSVPEVI